jgi:carbamoyl-phosphate synthase large subunit
MRNKIVQYFKNELKGEGLVIAADCSKFAPALYEADLHYVIPTMDDPRYLDEIFDICRRHRIKAVLSLIDPELSVLAKNRDRFLSIGTIPLVSDEDIVELCFDKYRFYKLLNQKGIRTATSYINKDVFFEDLRKGKIEFPVFVKPIRGSASININKVFSSDELNVLFDRYSDLMIQEYLDGVEYGVDAYIDMISGDLVSLFVKKKIRMRAGETDKSVSVKNQEIFRLIKELADKIKFRGVIDIDIFDVNGEYYISEINPRFGGGYPHAYECGVNIPKLIINNLMNYKNKSNIGCYKENIVMMKYSEVMFINNDN